MNVCHYLFADFDGTLGKFPAIFHSMATFSWFQGEMNEIGRMEGFLLFGPAVVSRLICGPAKT